MSRENRSVFGDLNARNELEVIDNIYDRTIITTNSANILNIMNGSSALNPDEEVIRKRGRKKTPKVSLLPLRRSPRKAFINNNSDIDSSQTPSSSQSDQTHDYFLRTPKKTMTSSTESRIPSKLSLTPSKSSSTPMTPQRVSPRKRLLLNSNDSGIAIDLSPAFSGHESTPNTSLKNSSKIVKTQTKNSILTKRRRRRYF